MTPKRICLFILLLVCTKAWCQQQDVDFHLNAHLFSGQKILKVKRDFHDIYLWVLGQNNAVYRVNSVTLAVDDYTSKFAAYHSLQFIDIMGHSADTAFIATNSTNVIEWANGSLRVIGSSDGIPATVKSIGIELGSLASDGVDSSKMLIGTEHGLRTFDIKTQSIGFLPDTGAWASNTAIAKSKIFESTYRSETYEDSTRSDESGWVTAETHYMPVQFNVFGVEIPHLLGPLVLSWVWEGNSTFGYHINTVFTLGDGVDMGADGFFSEYFWGSEAGMFQTKTQYSNNVNATGWSQYLKGVKVNKITDIFGLTSLSRYYSSFLKQTLLVGTDKGFYFSSSLYDPSGEYTQKFSLFHYDGLGNIPVNDICVNAVPDAQPICENGVWLAADDGLYLLKPDYGKYTDSQQQKFISFNGQPDTLSQMKICSLSSVYAVAHEQYNYIQWYKNGVELPGQSKDTLTITAAGDYNAVIYDPCSGSHIESNHLKVSVISSPVFSFNYPDKMPQCGNKPDTLKTDYSPSYHYRWYTDGQLNGDTTNSFIVNQSGKYKVEVSACSGTWLSSKEVEVDMVMLPVPQLSADKPEYCAEDTATLSVNIPQEAAYAINWYRDGTVLTADKDSRSIKTVIPGQYSVIVSSNIASCTQASGVYTLSFTPPPVFTSRFPDEYRSCGAVTLNVVFGATNVNYRYRWYTNGVLNGDTTANFVADSTGNYRVEASACPGSWVSSNQIHIDIVTLPVPVITADKPNHCDGELATLTLNTPPDAAYTINWNNKGVLVPGSANQSTLYTGVPGSYTVTLVSNIPNSDGSVCSQTSAVLQLPFFPHPRASITEQAENTLCAGQTVYLTAVHDEGTVLWSTGETTDRIAVTQTGTYTVTVTSPAGCTADTSITVPFFPDPALHMHDTTICTYKNQVVTLAAPAGYAQYSWNGVPGGATFDVSRPGTVSLTVTDVNGCQAAQQIMVADQCADVYIPNTFTPNGDGINDTWVIEGLDGDPTATVKVFSRYGMLVYLSTGYSTPWNGETGGKKLPAGVYYYLVTARGNKQKFSGALTIIY